MYNHYIKRVLDILISGAALLVRCGIDDEYCAIVGDQNRLRREYGLTGVQIAERIEKELI